MVTILKLNKYNPIFYDEYGYQKDEWTDISDIGKSFGGVILTRENYLKAENAYLSCFEYIMDQCDIEKLKVLKDSLDIQEFPNYQDNIFDLTDKDIINYDDKSWLDRSDIHRFLRLQIRGLTGYALTNQKDFFIWGNWDLYFDIGIPDNVKIDQEEIRQRGLYLKHFIDYSIDNPELVDYKVVLPNYSE